ncbi:DUF975 family protein [Oscillospiraceae bacterium WX1]
MWTREELKQNAKAVLRATYWETFVAYLIMMAISFAGGLMVSFIPGLAGLSSIALNIFVTLPLSVGMSFFLLQNRLAPPVIRNLFVPFESGYYWKVVGAMAWMYLFIFLWSLILLPGLIILFAAILSSTLPYGMMYGDFYSTGWSLSAGYGGYIPVSILLMIAGYIIVLIKTLSYSMTPYILADNPNIGYDRALKLSIAMTNGHKWNMFVLGLSFLGWLLLGTLALGIGTLFVMPYVQATYAELYVRLRDNAVRYGLCTPAELNLYVPGP